MKLLLWDKKKLIHAKSKRHCETMKNTYNMSVWGHLENPRITSETTPPVENPQYYLPPGEGVVAVNPVSNSDWASPGATFCTKYLS